MESSRADSATQGKRGLMEERRGWFVLTEEHAPRQSYQSSTFSIIQTTKYITRMQYVGTVRWLKIKELQYLFLICIVTD